MRGNITLVVDFEQCNLARNVLLHASQTDFNALILTHLCDSSCGVSRRDTHLAFAAFSYDPFATIVWAQGVFRVTNYTLESLESELEKCDFAVAIAQAGP
jgi:hypothetical protein